MMGEQARDNKLGYATFGLNAQKALTLMGCELTEEASVALHIMPPHLYAPVPGKYNVTCSMWESRDLPRAMARQLASADALIVPSWFCYHAFRRAGLTRPIHVVPLGLWPEHWPYAERTVSPGEPFRFLWVSARNERKGYQQLWQAWCEEFTPRDPVQLTLKTTVETDDGYPTFWRWQGITMDRRYLSREDLRALYEAHHALIFPTMGEGFGLPLLEALASGMLVIAPFTTGQRDFLNKSVAWRLDTKPQKASYGVQTEVPVPTIASIRRQMRAAVQQFTETKALRERGSAQAHQYTWERTARGLMAVCARVG